MPKPGVCPIIQVDSFTNRPFSGNPAAVCVMAEPRDDSWMQGVATEMNLSETAFLHPKNGGFALRWFTPNLEVALCGHATLASAHVLWEDGHLSPEQEARFFTKSGLLTASRRGEWIEMDFPAKLSEPCEPPPDLLPALGITAPYYVGRNEFDYLVDAPGEEIVRGLSPDFVRLRNLDVRGVIVTSRSTQYDFISRFFAPRAGVDEDPVTGSAHCALAPYWAAKLGKNEFNAFQASRRGGFLKLRLEGDRVRLIGQAVIVIRGELLV